MSALFHRYTIHGAHSSIVVDLNSVCAVKVIDESIVIVTVGGPIGLEFGVAGAANLARTGLLEAIENTRGAGRD